MANGTSLAYPRAQVPLSHMLDSCPAVFKCVECSRLWRRDVMLSRVISVPPESWTDKVDNAPGTPTCRRFAACRKNATSALEAGSLIRLNSGGKQAEHILVGDADFSPVGMDQWKMLRPSSIQTYLAYGILRLPRAHFTQNKRRKSCGGNVTSTEGGLRKM